MAKNKNVEQKAQNTPTLAEKVDTNKPNAGQQSNAKPAEKKTNTPQPVKRKGPTREEIINDRINDAKDILSSNTPSATRLSIFIASEKRTPNAPCFISDAKFGEVKLPNGRKVRRYNLDIKHIQNQLTLDLTKWLLEFETIKDSISKTREFIPSISKSTFPNNALRVQNQELAEAKMAEVITLFSKAGELIEEIKQMGFSDKKIVVQNDETATEEEKAV